MILIRQAGAAKPDTRPTPLFRGRERNPEVALAAAAAARPVPIPVYAEMGSTNPIFVLPGAMPFSAASSRAATRSSGPRTKDNAT